MPNNVGQRIKGLQLLLPTGYNGMLFGEYNEIKLKL